jgi:hypothetical protein
MALACAGPLGSVWIARARGSIELHRGAKAILCEPTWATISGCAGSPRCRRDHVAIDVVVRLQPLDERRDVYGAQVCDEIVVRATQRLAGDEASHAVAHVERLERVRDRIERCPDLVGYRRDAR